ncbi:bifunctional DNA-formamidopyrimidine glycosylase/DNA-(apurinic or apyrimidinic site) lyase [Moraxella oblonga]|uniref:bifunctional DNA-formamidopyrimidine glycosylase/DNA-(apurinic or apyrimidinic site) lyase n=1 Tax=Moraxella oblonga TaxID=200413 RepID=UPI0008362E1D|nr:bifunctional DNA-formamidopyrimidine glycosylase/DNA-(apurinic or apyrimidinic site) lyase [Moraxella oblonga]
MPELPEVQTTKLSLSPLLGKTINDIYLSGYRLREPIPNDLDQLVGATLNDVTRRAKYLILFFKNGDDTLELLIHLGMSGSLQQHIGMTPRKHDHVIFGFDDIRLHYHDPRRFGMVMWADDARRYLDKLGVEPLDEVFDVDYLASFAKKTHKPIKTLIMEQSVVVGVGNIYAVESLFMSGIHPATPACTISHDKLAKLVLNIKTILARSIEQGGSSLKDFTVGAGKTGYFQQTLLVYGRAGESCTKCTHPLENTKIGGRASVYCPICQPL